VTAIPPEILTAAELRCDAAGIWALAIAPDPVGRQARRDILSAAIGEAWPMIAEIEQERLYAELGSDHHVIFGDDGWTVEHSVECRLSGSMTGNCAYWTALKHHPVTDWPDPDMAGRWRIDSIDSEGAPMLVRAGGDDD
jgi:hypothetical protein